MRFGSAYNFESDGYDASSWLRHVYVRLLIRVLAEAR